MELKDQVNTKKQGKKFAKLFKGIKKPPESYFVWVSLFGFKPEIRYKKAANHYIKVPAFGSAELSSLLPKPRLKKDGFYNRSEYIFPSHKFPYSQRSKLYEAWQNAFDQYARDLASSDVLEAHAKADLLLRLIKKGIIKPEDLKL